MRLVILTVLVVFTLQPIPAQNTKWGKIGGTLSNQADLQNALNSKQGTLPFPLSLSLGGNGTSVPALKAGQGISLTGSWPNYTISSTGGGSGGAAVWGGITGVLTDQQDLGAALGAKQGALTFPLTLAQGGTGTTAPTLTAGTPNVTINGSWPNQSISVAASSGGGGTTVGVPGGATLPAACTPGTDTLFLKTNGTINQQLYTCSSLNAWTLNMLLGSSGALSINQSTGALDIVTTVLPRTNTANVFTGRNSFTVSDFTQQAKPASAGAGKLSLYAHTDGSLHVINAAGTDSPLALGSGFANPLTSEDDLIVAAQNGAAARLAKGADNQVIGVDPNTHHVSRTSRSQRRV
jgi:hypothetical protein